MQLADVVTIADLSGSTGIIESVIRHDDLTVYAVRTLSGMRYARTAGELIVAPADVAEGFVRDLRILAAHHADLRPAVAALANRAPEVVEIVGAATAQPEQVRAWLVRHNLDKLATLTAEAVLAARTADHVAALALNASRPESPLDVMRRIGRESGQPVVQVAYPAAPSACLHAGCHPGRCVYGSDHGTPRAPRTRRRLVINGEQIA
jgi:hypothetical protein